MTIDQLNGDLSLTVKLTAGLKHGDAICLRRLLTKAHDEIGRLMKLNESLAERVAPQSESLTHGPETGCTCHDDNLEAAQAACAAYRGFLTAECAFERFRDETYRDTASGRNAAKMEAWLAANDAASIGGNFLKHVETLRGAMAADDKRLRAAGLRIGIIGGCDTASDMADEIESLRSRLADTEGRAALADRLVMALRHALEHAASGFTCEDCSKALRDYDASAAR